MSQTNPDGVRPMICDGSRQFEDDLLKEGGHTGSKMTPSDEDSDSTCITPTYGETFKSEDHGTSESADREDPKPMDHDSPQFDVNVVVTAEDNTSFATDESELTSSEVEEIFLAVRQGDIDRLDDLLDLPGADINLEWFSENLLTAAIKARQTTMAKFLIENGVNYNYEVTTLEASDRLPAPRHTTIVDRYTTSCRQLAYDHDLMTIVEMIDERNHQAWPRALGYRRTGHGFLHMLRTATVPSRLKKPLVEKLRERTRLWTEHGVLVPSESSVGCTNDDDEKSSGYFTLSGSSSGSSAHDLPVTSRPSCRRLISYPHRFRDTKSSLSKRGPNRRPVSPTEAGEGPLTSKLPSPSSPRPAPGSYPHESRMWARSERPGSFKASPRLPIPQEGRCLTRTVTPWRDNPTTPRVRPWSAADAGNLRTPRGQHTASINHDRPRTVGGGLLNMAQFPAAFSTDRSFDSTQIGPQTRRSRTFVDKRHKMLASTRPRTVPRERSKSPSPHRAIVRSSNNSDSQTAYRDEHKMTGDLKRHRADMTSSLHRTSSSHSGMLKSSPAGLVRSISFKLS